MHATKNICIIPARGGSKRIPHKNIIDLCGKPMIAYTIEAAVAAGLFGEHIYVSSDAPDILRIAEGYGARAILRPSSISGDSATLEEAALHLLQTVQKKFDYLCMLLPNCPLRTGTDIKNAFTIIKKTGAHCLMSVVDYHWLNPFWALKEKKGFLTPFFGKKFLVNSQNLPSVVCPSGAVRWVQVKNFVKEKRFYGKKLAKYDIPFERAVDIDTYDDLALAKQFMRFTR